MPTETTQENSKTMSEQSTSNTSSQTSDKLQALVALYQDEEWRKAQDKKLVEGIEVALNIITNLSQGVEQFLEKFYGFVYDVSNNPLVGMGSHSDGYNAPTQTPANRATRRARAKK